MGAVRRADLRRGDGAIERYRDRLATHRPTGQQARHSAVTGTARAGIGIEAGRSRSRYVALIALGLSMPPPETAGDLECGLADLFHDVVEPVAREPERGAGDAHGSDHVTVNVADRC